MILRTAKTTKLIVPASTQLGQLKVETLSDCQFSEPRDP